MSEPLILTALLDPTTQQRFDRLRRQHFPPERNHLDAHLTLFHQLPGPHRAEIEDQLRDVAARAPIAARVTGLRLLGRGVAFVLRSDELTELRATLSRRWADWLSAQDRTKSDLHVTVQNKVDPAIARTLHARLAADFVPQRVDVLGLGLWRYLGGPWQAERRFRFDAG